MHEWAHKCCPQVEEEPEEEPEEATEDTAEDTEQDEEEEMDAGAEEEEPETAEVEQTRGGHTCLVLETQHYCQRQERRI